MEEATMTRLEQIEYRLNYLLSQYEDKKYDPGYRLQLAILAAERRNILRQQEKPVADVD